MAPFDGTSMLHGLDSNDTRALRRVMNGVLRRLAGTLRDDSAHRQSLEENEFGVVEQIIDETADNTLVRNAAVRFASMHMAPSNDVSRFAQEFNIVVQPGIVGPVNLRDAEDVKNAQVTFENFVDNGPAVVYPTDADGDPMLLDDSASEEENFKMEDSEEEVTPVPTGKRKVGLPSDDMETRTDNYQARC
jgi:hypothetical protein